jgi:peroxiredoxin
MLKRCATLLYFAVAMANGQSRIDLLRRAGEFYRNQDSFDVKGVASARVPDSSWRLTYDIEIEAAQPRFIPVGVRRNSMQGVITTGNPHLDRVIADATDPLPVRGPSMRPFTRYDTLADRLIDAQRVGVETVKYRDHDYLCEIIDAAYDVSPAYKPKSASSHFKVYIDPDTLWVLKEIAPDPEVGEWTFAVTSLVFDQPPSEALTRALEGLANRRKSKPKWEGRDAPDFALDDLSGNRVRLADLRGHPILLDFWGSYCAPCKRATALAEQFADAYKKAGLVVWGVTRDTPGDARSWLNFNHLGLPALLDPDGVAFKRFEVEGVPVAILIDEQGKVVNYWEGVDTKTELQTAVERILNRRP